MLRTTSDQDNLYPGYLADALDKWFIPSTPGSYPGQLFYPQDTRFIPTFCALYTMFFGEPLCCGCGSGVQGFGNLSALLESS